MTAKLGVRIMVNASPFYYGRLMVDYNPLHGNDFVTQDSVMGAANIMGASQRPHCFINPTSSTPVQLELPFVYYKDAVSVVGGGWNELGLLSIRELAPLKHANDSVQPITITFFAWAMDVQLAAPTLTNASGLVAQSGPEKAGPVQSAAEMVGSGAGYLSSVPSLGPMAVATRGVAGAVGKMAKAFGWSKPAITDPLVGMNMRAISDLAPADAGDNVSRLTVEGEAQVTVDPRVVGIVAEDELAVTSLAARESWLGAFGWTDTSVAGTLLWNAKVHPAPYITNGFFRHFPACAIPCIFTKFWRGTVRYHFQVCSSEHHRGRLRIVWDPHQSAASPELNIQRTVIIDIGENTDFEIDVQWGQTTSYLTLPTWGEATTTYLSGVSPITFDANANGTLSIYVLNSLALPASLATTILTQVYISCPDLEVAVPVDPNFAASRFVDVIGSTPQSGPMRTMPLHSPELPVPLPQIVPDGPGAKVYVAPSTQAHIDVCLSCSQAVQSIQSLTCMGTNHARFQTFGNYIDHMYQCDDCHMPLLELTAAIASTEPHDTLQGSVAQSGPETQCDCAPVRHVMAGASPAPEASLIYFGEKILSMRQLLKRYCLTYTLAANGGIGTLEWVHHEQTDMPALPGYRNLTLTTSTANTKYNYTPNSVLTILPSAFLACRGSLRTKYVASNPNVRLTVTRGNASVNTTGLATSGRGIVQTTITNAVATTTSAFARTHATTTNWPRGGYGAMTSSAPKPVIEVEFPYYSQYRFRHARDTRQSVSSNGLTDSYHSLDAMWTNPISTGTVAPLTLVDRYAAVGEDFTLTWFLGLPPLRAFTDPA